MLQTLEITRRARAQSSPMDVPKDCSKEPGRSSSAPLSNSLLATTTKVFIVLDKDKSCSNGFRYRFQYNNNFINSEKFTATVGSEIKIFTDKAKIYLDASGEYALATTTKFSSFTITRNMTIICDDNGKISIGKAFLPINY